MPDIHKVSIVGKKVDVTSQTHLSDALKETPIRAPLTAKCLDVGKRRKIVQCYALPIIRQTTFFKRTSVTEGL